MPDIRWFRGGAADSGPCSPNKIFVDVDGVYGGCRCRDRNHLLWQTDDRCYRAFTKVDLTIFIKWGGDVTSCYLVAGPVSTGRMAGTGLERLFSLQDQSVSG